MASVLNNRVSKWEDMTRYIISIRAHGTEILPPSINKSSVYFAVESEKGKEAIRFGLGALKNVGIGVIEKIIEERKCGKYKSFQNFCKRVPSEVLNKKCLESLILSGAFDELGANRSQLMAVYPKVVSLIQTEKKATDSGQISMFGLVEDSSAAQVAMPDVPEFDNLSKSKFEREVVGIYLSGHPLEQFVAEMEDCNFNTSQIRKKSEENETESEEEHEVANNSPVTMAAVIVEFKKVLTKATKQEMAIVKVEDLYGSCDVMLFPKVYEKVKMILVKDAVVKIDGKLSIREGEDAIILADTIKKLRNETDTPAEIHAENETAADERIKYMPNNGYFY
jgi:DNA polymerase-3 subunit alpha